MCVSLLLATAAHAGEAAPADNAAGADDAARTDTAAHADAAARTDTAAGTDADASGDPARDGAPWLDGDNGGLVGPYAYSQAVTDSATLFPAPVDQGGVATGVRGDLWLSWPSFPYVGLESSGQLTRWSIDPEPLCDAMSRPCPGSEAAPTTLLDLRLSLAGRYTHHAPRFTWRAGADAGIGDGEITALLLDGGSVDVKKIAVPALEVGARGGLEAGRYSADVRVAYRFAGGSVPLGLRTSLVGRYRVVDGFWIGVGVDERENTVALYDQHGAGVAELHDALVDLALLVGYRR